MNRNFVPSAFRNLKSAATTIAVGVGLFVSLGSRDAVAQPAPPGAGGTVNGSGQVTLTRQPNVLRMTMEVTGEGKDVATALAKLKSEKEQVAAKLKALGAAEASVKFDAPRVGGAGGAGGNAARQRAMQVQMSRMRGRGAPTTRPGAAPEAPKVEVSAKVTAEWPFEAAGGSPEEVIVAAYTLREKVKAGGLSKKAGKANLTPEEQEELEEMEAMNMNDYGVPANMPGEPAFVFVCKVPAAERDAATAEAFKKAKDDAARLATAAGAALGEIRQIAGQSAAVAGDGLDGNDYYGGGYNYQAQMMRQLGLNVPGSNVEEAAGFEPGPVSLQVIVTATFAIR